MHEPYTSHSLVRTSPFYTSPFCRLPGLASLNLGDFLGLSVAAIFYCLSLGVVLLVKTRHRLSGPLDRLNAILSLLQPLDRYRAPSAIQSAIGRPLSRPISHPRTGRSPQPPRSKPLRGAQPRDSGAIVSQTSLKQARNENTIEAAILNRVLDRDWSLNRRGPLRTSRKGAPGASDGEPISTQ